MTATERREKVAAKYREILGRNNYSQTKRDYCFKKASDGKYYSDCSSSVSYCYKEAGEGFGILNTVGMYQSKKFTDVPVIIKGGQIQNPEVLRVGDMLLYAGTDSSRSYAGYVGHVEMVGEIGAKVILYGHGSGTPKKTEMTVKNKSRYNSKTSTKIGNKGLIRVVRYIQDDAPEPEPKKGFVEITGGTVNIRQSAAGELYKPERYGYRGDVLEFSATETVNGTVWYRTEFGWISGKYAEVVK